MRAILLLAVTLLLAACADDPESSSTGASPAPVVEGRASMPATASASPAPAASSPAASTAESPPTIAAVGDIASCDVEGDSATAALVPTGATVVTLGDNVYPAGSDETYADCYDPAWGAFRDRTRPSAGNHDLRDDGGAAYWRYFGDQAGRPGEGWYSFDLGEWHLVALNSNCELIPCGPGSPQYEWLVDDLAASDATCTVAYMHHARFSSGPNGDYPPVTPLWDALDAAGADVLLVGHDHLYERFAPQGSTGAPTPDGIRQFTAGTGGYELYAQERVAPNSEVVIDDTFGVLFMALAADSYEWSFVGVDGREVDSGTDRCR